MKILYGIFTLVMIVAVSYQVNYLGLLVFCVISVGLAMLVLLFKAPPS